MSDTPDPIDLNLYAPDIPEATASADELRSLGAATHHDLIRSWMAAAHLVGEQRLRADLEAQGGDEAAAEVFLTEANSTAQWLEDAFALVLGRYAAALEAFRSRPQVRTLSRPEMERLLDRLVKAGQEVTGAHMNANSCQTDMDYRMADQAEEDFAQTREEVVEALSGLLKS